MKIRFRMKAAAAFSAALLTALMPVAGLAQTKVNLPKNKYEVKFDVEKGQEVARQVERQFPMVNDNFVENYVERVGARLVAVIPANFRQPAFDYSFKVVNASDINAFALPGGPMFVNRGMIQAARNEGEMAGVMAHEISHVALRHATAQATKQSNIWNQLGTVGLILGGAVAGGQAGAQLGALAATAWQTKYSRDYETQADILGAQIMAAAGYDPADLANMFQTIARQGGGRGPEFLSSHPDPGNRFEKINREASMLNVSSNPIKNTRDFERAQARLAEMPPARTMAQIQQESQSGQGTGTSPTAGGTYSRSVPYPGPGYRTYNGGDISFSVPSNWREFSGEGSLVFAPNGAFGDQGITHGTMFGIYRPNSRVLLTETRNYVNGLLQSNRYLSQRNNFVRRTVGSRPAYSTVLAGRSPITNRTEVVYVYTIQLRNGNLLTLAAVAPEDELFQYDRAFSTMLNSMRIYS
ncbi:MAG: M48 family metalloprotease [Pyrinomonadaceae bacterium]